MDKAKVPALMIGGFGGFERDEPFPTTAENAKNTQMVINEWSLGPLVPSIDPKANDEFRRSILGLYLCPSILILIAATFPSNRTFFM